MLCFISLYNQQTLLEVIWHWTQVKRLVFNSATKDILYAALYMEWKK